MKTLDNKNDVDAITLSNIIMSLYSTEFSKNNLQIGLSLYLYNNVRSKKL